MDEAVPFINSDPPPSRYDQFIERFLKDDGTICLGFIVLVFSIYKAGIYMKHKMSVRSQSSDSSSGLSSTSTANSNASSGLGSTDSERTGKSKLSKSKSKSTTTMTSSGVPLSRTLVYLFFVSVFGFIWGQQFSDNAEMKAAVTTIASLVGTKQLVTNQETNSFQSDAENDTDTKTSMLLQRYIKEQEERNVALPSFASDTKLDNISKQFELNRRKRTVEFIVHPILLASGKASETVAIAVNTDPGNNINPKTSGIELAKDLLQEILVYKEVHEITVFLVSSQAASKKGCPIELGVEEFLALDQNANVEIECHHIDPAWGDEKEGYIEDEIISDDDYDVSIVLSGCNTHDDDITNRIWEEELCENTNSIVSTCSGPMRVPGKSITGVGQTEQFHRFVILEEFFAKSALAQQEEDSSESPAALGDQYDHVIDYDILGLNMAVAFNNNFYRWHLNEPNYNANLLARLKDGSRKSLLFFDSPDMATIEYASRQSVESYCAYLRQVMDDDDDDDDDEEEEEEEEKWDLFYCEPGFNPNYDNIPVEKTYVGKSGSGENAGRGVFTSVDILERKTYVGMESNVESVHYPATSKAIVNKVMDMKVYDSFDEEIDDDDDDDDDEDDDNKNDGSHWGESELMTNRLHRAPSTYAEAYGFDDEPWGIPQTSVMSNILTFVNHGCNGTANIGINVPGKNEFTMDIDSPDFEIPEEFLQHSAGYYSPHRDRIYMRSVVTTMVFHPPVLAGEELFDNYIEFGGMKHFVDQVKELRQDCSGALGTVEKQQHFLKKKAKIENPKSHTTNDDDKPTDEPEASESSNVEDASADEL